MNDLISRAAVVDAIEGVDWYHINKNGEMVHGANDAEHQAWYKAEDIYKAVESVPSAQPVAKDTNVPVKDCISRQAAIETVRKAKNIYQAYRMLVQLPTEQKKGHWIDEGTSYSCSECHRGCWVNSNYCPWCGADMRGESDG